LVIALAIAVLALIDARRHHNKHPLQGGRILKDGRFKHDAIIATPFKFNVCDGAKGTMINSLTITPAPIVLGQNITVSASVTVNQPFDSSTISSIAVTIQKQVFGAWIDIPCVDGLGSCTFDANGCDQIAKNQAQICAVLQPLGLPCQCPFQPGTYSTPGNGISVQTQDPGISWATDGNFYVKVILKGATEYFCTEAYFSLASKDMPKNVIHRN